MHVSRIALNAGLLALALAVPLTAAADTYDYSYSETAIDTAMFTYDSPTLITTDTVFTPLTCSTTIPGDGACTTVEIDPTAQQILMNFVGGGNINTTGLPATFFDVGDNAVGNNVYVMDITDVPDTAPTPEPSSFLLLGTGLLAMGAALRRRPIRAMMER